MRIFYVLIAVILFSCVTETVLPPVELGYGYYPISIGSHKIYQVDSVVYQTSLPDTTYSYQIKEVQESLFDDNEGRVNVRLERSRRDHDSLPWIITDVWPVYKGLENLEKVEENLRYIRIAFPVNEEKLWDGNALNSNDERIFVYRDLHASKTIGPFSFDSTITTFFEDPNLISPKKEKEIYAKNIGLVKRFWRDFNNPDDGTEVTMELIEYEN